jgi:hypothetical protein
MCLSLICLKPLSHYDIEAVCYVTAKFADRGCHVVSATDPYGR